MSTANFAGVACWDQARIPELFQTEATKPPRELFLAAHSPIQGFTVDRGQSTLAESTEEALAKIILNRKSEHAFIVVRGVNGSGKSHLIAWLHERVYPACKTDRVIFIARHNASLRGVLEQLAEKLEDQTLLDGLEEAVGLSEMGRQVAFLDKLAVRVDPEMVQDRFADDDLAAELNVAGFLRDNTVRRLWRQPDGPVSRICGQIVEGRSVVKEDRSRFELEDFQSILRTTTGNFGPEAKAVIDRVRQDHPLRARVIAILNDRTRDAIREWFRIDRTALTRRFGEIRRKLFPQRLVLLIEDISCFTGVDDQLIEALIHDVPARDQWAPLCSVVGVTDKYFEDYIRAKGHMRDRITHLVALGGEGSEACVLSEDRRNRFVARYLNALRTDRDRLREWSRHESEAHPTLPPSRCDSCPHREPCHASFGQVDGMGLYPFNSVSLRRIVDALYDHDKGKPAPTPRHLIYFLRDAIPSRDTLSRGHFPPSTLPTEWIDEQRLPARKDSVKQRAVALFGQQAPQGEMLLRLWGEHNADDVTRDGIRLVGGLRDSVFTALNIRVAPPRPSLQPPSAGSKPSGQSQTEIPSNGSSPTVPDQVVPGKSASQVAPPKAAEREANVEEWLGGGDLQFLQEHRTALHTLLRDTIAWEAAGIPDALVRDLFTMQSISFDGYSAKGVLVALPRDPLVADALRALQRLTYEDDLEERMVKRDQIDRFIAVWGPKIADAVAARLPSSAQGLWNPAIAATQLLYVDAVMSGVNVEAMSLPELVQALFFEPWPSPSVEGRSDLWARLSKSFSASVPGGSRSQSRTMREELRRISLDWLDRRPGSRRADSPCLDAAIILEPLLAFRKTLTLVAPPQSSGGPPEPLGLGRLESLLADVTATVPKMLDDERSRCARWLELLEMLGPDEDLSALKRAGEAALKAIEAARGVAHSVSRNRFQKALYEATPYATPEHPMFRTSTALADHRKCLKAITRSTANGTRLAAVAKVAAEEVSAITSLIDSAERMVSPLEAEDGSEGQLEVAQQRLAEVEARIFKAKAAAQKALSDAAKEMARD